MIGGVILSHDAAGSGPALVLLHSGVCDRRMWDPQWEALRAVGYRVVRPDLRGFGETPAEAGDYDPVADVWELLDSLGIERAALIGASYGGKLALAAAARHPERVTALALLASGLPGRAPSAELRAWGAREDALLNADDLDGAVALNVDTWLGPHATPGTRAAVAEMQRHAFRVQLAAEAAEAAAEAATEAATEAAAEAEAATVTGTAGRPGPRPTSRKRRVRRRRPGRLPPSGTSPGSRPPPSPSPAPMTSPTTARSP